MKRIVKIPDILQDKKYELIKEYMNFGIYQERCPNGYFVNQSYLLSNGNICLQTESYNHFCCAELLDIIDYYNETGKFGVKALKRTYGYCVHPSGDLLV